ncbi:MAG: PAS domain S-box protein [Chloroflexi bacterium]|nr:PAS domain S-box protein [Chloroflexota bacterium]
MISYETEGSNAMEKKIRILHLEDDDADAELIIASLESAGVHCKITRVQSSDDFSSALSGGGYDLILADYSLPGYSGLSALNFVREQYPTIPFIFVSGTMGEDAAIRALTEGATDYVLKQKLSRIAPAIKRALRDADNRNERRRAEEALRKNNALLEQIFSTTEFMVVYLDADFNFIRVNRAYAQTAEGCDPKFFEGKNHFALYPNAENEAIFRKVVETGEPYTVYAKPFEYAGHPERGITYWNWSLQPVRDESGHVGGLVFSLIDVTKRERAYIALRQREEQLRLQSTALDAAANGFLITDRTGKIMWVNPAFTRLTGYSFQEAVGQNPKILKSGKHGYDFYKDLWTTILAGKIWDGELVNRRKDGHLYTEEMTIAPLRGEDGEISHFIAVKQDVSERKQAEEKIRRQINYITALQDIDRTIASEIGMYPSLTALISKAVTVLSADAAAILLINFNTGTLDFFTGKGFHTEAITNTRLKLKESYASKAIIEKRIVKFPNPKEEAEDLLFTKFLQEEKFTGYYGVPLIIKDRVIGVLEVYQRSPVKRDQEWLDFLNALAGQAAVAIDNAQLFENLQHSNLELTLAYDATIEGWSHAMDLRDRETEGHTQRVSTLTVQLARRMGIPETDILHIRRGALLHDIGKIGVPDNILHKDMGLTEDEWKIMRKHPVYAYEMLVSIDYLKPALDIPYCHHEKWDGSGYPRGIKGEQIPLAARIFAVIDVWDALTSDRPYRKAWTKEKALNYIREQSGTHFDPQIVEKFMERKEK